MPEPEPEPPPLPPEPEPEPPPPEPPAEPEPHKPTEEELEARRAQRMKVGGKVKPGKLGLKDKPKRSFAWIGWVFVVLFIVGSLAAAVLLRKEIVKMVPEAAPMYDMIGLGVQMAGDGLELQNVRSAVNRDGDTLILVVEGDIANVIQEKRPVPRVRVALKDRAGKEVYFWTFSIDQAEIEPGQKLPFVTRLPSPPDRAHSLATSFVDE
jgi:hypothetical protein